MSDEIRTVYMCNVCKHFYDSKERCQECVNSHKPYARVKLQFIKGNYSFVVQPFNLEDGYDRLYNDKVRAFGAENDYPTFQIECKNNSDGIKEAKSYIFWYVHRLISQLNYFVFEQIEKSFNFDKEAKDDSDGK